MSEDLDRLDRLAAEIIMGYKPNNFGHVAYGLKVKGQYEIFYGDSSDYFEPTRNISQAWELLEKFKDVTYYYPHIWFGGKYWHAYVDKNILWAAEEKTAPLAIVKACLLAKGVEI